MSKSVTLLVGLVVGGSLLSSCAGPSATTETSATDTSATTGTTAPTGSTTATTGSSLKDPQGSIAYQLDLIKAGDAGKLKTCLTARVRDRVTQAVVDKAKNNAAKYTIDDLYASSEMGEAGGKKTAKVKMKNGRTLTTLVQTEGQWLADTIWFK